MRPAERFLPLGLALALLGGIAWGDEVVKVNGIKLSGQVITESPDYVQVRVEFGGSPVTLKVKIREIHTITIAGKTRVLNARRKVRRRRPRTYRKPVAVRSRPPRTLAPRGRSRRGPKRATQAKIVSRARIEALIQQAGRTPPSWWNAVPLKVPAGLDLTWKKPPKGWNARKWLGQYIWSIINENPRKWKEGIRLLHHTLAVNKSDSAKVRKSINALGTAYAELLGDWARAAFWWRKGGGGGHGYGQEVALALCYWKLGNKPMAVETLSKVTSDFTRGGMVIKLWADLGYLDKALQMAERNAKGRRAGMLYRVAGDACRQSGQYKRALAYYQKVLDQGGKDKWNKDRARAAMEAIKLVHTLKLRRVANGTHTGASLGYTADVHVEVVVKGGEIRSVRVVRHKEKQYYSSITDTPRQIVEKQGIRGVDAVTGATLTSNAILNATAKALLTGMK